MKWMSWNNCTPWPRGNVSQNSHSDRLREAYRSSHKKFKKRHHSVIVSKIRKIQDISTFCKEFIPEWEVRTEFHYDNITVTVTSVINVKYCDVTGWSTPRKEQRSVIRFSGAHFIQIYTNVYRRFFIFWKLTEWCRFEFWNLFAGWPSYRAYCRRVYENRPMHKCLELLCNRIQGLIDLVVNTYRPIHSTHISFCTLCTIFIINIYMCAHCLDKVQPVTV